MRILLDQSVHDHRNTGNNALLEVALKRFNSYWPEASFDVISVSPHLCKVLFPNTNPVDPHISKIYKSNLDVLDWIMPRMIRRSLFELREMFLHRLNLSSTSRKFRKLVSSWRQRNDQKHNKGFDINMKSNPDVDHSENGHYKTDYYPKISEYDLLVATGGGYMCDSDEQRLLQVFDRLDAAVYHNIPAVMVGQGVGPMEKSILLQRAKEVLPKIDYILVREELFARRILESVDVPEDKIIMTGDDAIELAYQIRSKKRGTGIGLSLRVSHYTEINKRNIEAIRSIVIKAAKKFNAELISAPTDVNDSDKKYIEEIMQDYPRTFSSWRKFELSSEIINRIGRCRLMISGTFHGAVFALAQGIPVVALAKSEEYLNKFTGLANEYVEKGCQVINLNNENLDKEFSEAIDLAWKSSDLLHNKLLIDSKRQINLGYSAYQRIFEFVESKRRKPI